MFDWFENYLEMMDKARKALEKFAMEQAEMASNADKASASSGRKKRVLRFACARCLVHVCEYLHFSIY